MPADCPPSCCMNCYLPYLWKSAVDVDEVYDDVDDDDNGDDDGEDGDDDVDDADDDDDDDNYLNDDEDDDDDDDNEDDDDDDDNDDEDDDDDDDNEDDDDDDDDALSWANKIDIVSHEIMSLYRSSFLIEFKYSTRVVCTYFISFIGIYMVSPVLFQ